MAKKSLSLVITVTVSGNLVRPGQTNPATLTLPSRATVTSLLDHLKIREAHRHLLLVSRGKAHLSAGARLRARDRIFILLPLGGG